MEFCQPEKVGTLLYYIKTLALNREITGVFEKSKVLRFDRIYQVYFLSVLENSEINICVLISDQNYRMLVQHIPNCYQTRGVNFPCLFLEETQTHTLN